MTSHSIQLPGRTGRLDRVGRICYVASAFWCAALFTTMPACAQTPYTPTTPEQASTNAAHNLPNRSAMVVNPQTAEAFFANLKLAFDNDWLLRTEFYDEVYLKEFFGAGQVNKYQHLPPIFGGNSFSNGRGLRPIDMEIARTLPYFDQTDASIRGGIQIRAVNKTKTGFSVSFRDRTASVEVALEVFGSKWRLVRPRPMPSGHRIIGPITHQLGFDHLVYEMSNDLLRRQIDIHTHENGSIATIYLTIEEK